MKIVALFALLFCMSVGVPSAHATITACTSNFATADANGGTIAVTLATTAGHLNVVFVKHEGTAGTTTVSDATSTLSLGTQVAGSPTSIFAYILVSNGGNRTFTATFNANKTFRRIIAWDCPYTGTASFDVQPAGGGASGTSTAINSGNFTTTGTDEIVFGGYGEFTTNTLSSPLINGVAPDASVSTVVNGTTSWYKIETAAFTGGAASATLAPSGAWNCNAIAFKATASVTPKGFPLGFTGFIFGLFGAWSLGLTAMRRSPILSQVRSDCLSNACGN